MTALAAGAHGFELPPELEAHTPPEWHAGGRDDVRMLVARRATGELELTHFRELARLLAPGDLVVLNTSATVPASLQGLLDGEPVDLRLSGPAPSSLDWIVELRHPAQGATLALPAGAAGCAVTLPAGATAVLRERMAGSTRLWLAELRLLSDPLAFLSRYGAPVRYAHAPGDWPLEAYQTVYATEPGSAEMPSAGRAFTPELITSLIARGVAVAPVLLHAGLSSPEAGEPPQAERYRVPAATARLVDVTHEAAGHVIAVGTTVVRALESASDEYGRVHAAEGFTDLVISPGRGVRAVDAILTGWHEPRASHLDMLEAIAGPELLADSYRAALADGLLWHEFGDLHLVLPA